MRQQSFCHQKLGVLQGFIVCTLAPKCWESWSSFSSTTCTHDDGLGVVSHFSSCFTPEGAIIMRCTRVATPAPSTHVTAQLNTHARAHTQTRCSHGGNPFTYSCVLDADTTSTRINQLHFCHTNGRSNNTNIGCAPWCLEFSLNHVTESREFLKSASERLCHHRIQMTQDSNCILSLMGLERQCSGGCPCQDSASPRSTPLPSRRRVTVTSP